MAGDSQKTKKTSWSTPPFGTAGQILGILILLFVAFRMFGGGISFETQVAVKPEINNEDNIVNKEIVEKTEATQTSYPAKKIEKILKGNIKIEKMQVQLGGLNPIIISVKNEGNVPFSPDVNIRIKQNAETICDVNPFSGYLGDEPIGVLNIGESVIRKIDVLTCRFPRNGKYLIETILINSKTLSVLDRDEQALEVQDQLLQELESNCNMLEKLCENHPDTCESYELAKIGGQC